jgi:hypothetical protein
MDIQKVNTVLGKAILSFQEEEIEWLSEEFGKGSSEQRAIQLVYSAGITHNQAELQKVAKKLGISIEKIAYKAFEQRMKALKAGARPVSGTKNDLKAEMMALAKSARALGVMDVLKKVAAKYSPKKSTLGESETKEISIKARIQKALDTVIKGRKGWTFPVIAKKKGVIRGTVRKGDLKLSLEYDAEKDEFVLFEELDGKTSIIETGNLVNVVMYLKKQIKYKYDNWSL